MRAICQDMGINVKEDQSIGKVSNLCKVYSDHQFVKGKVLYRPDVRVAAHTKTKQNDAFADLKTQETFFIGELKSRRSMCTGQMSLRPR